ncbi:MAG: tetratricopeptide repeat protein [Opitutus sp.]|nr:tetratricopeptide repeat protein [Opitutus sp.]
MARDHGAARVSAAPPPSPRWLIVLQAAVILAAGWFAFSPALHGSWLWDDRLDLPDNALLRDTAGLAKIWTEPALLYDFYPLKHTVQWVQWQLWHEHTFGYHLTNVALHLLGALLFWRVLRQLGLRLAWLGALLFAVHPVVVESVAWIAELKNTLALPPLLLALSAFITFAEHGRRSDQLRAVLWFLVTMLCKTSAAMLPVVLLLYLWWQRGRVGWSGVRAVLPFFAISLVLGLVTIWFQQHRAIGDDEFSIGGPLARLALAGSASVFYFWKCVWPAGLVPIYPQWPIDPPSPLLFLPWPVLGAVLAGLWAKRATWGRHVLLGLGWFFLMLAPFSGLVTISYLHFAWVMDHMVYVPLLGLIALAVAGLDALQARLAAPARTLLVAGTVALGLWLSLLSHRYAEVFRDEKSLWTYTVERNPQSWIAQHSLGIALATAGRLPEAIEHYEHALRARPNYPEARNSLGVALRDTGRLAEARSQLEEALREQPDYAEAHSNLGTVLRRTGHPDEAILHYQEAIRLKPDFADAHYNLGNALQSLGRHPEAVASYEQSLRFQPNLSGTHRNITISLFALGRVPEAKAHYARARELDPSLPNVTF